MTVNGLPTLVEIPMTSELHLPKGIDNVLNERSLTVWVV